MALGYRGMAQDGPLFPRTPGLYRAWVWHAKWRAAVGRPARAGGARPPTTPPTSPRSSRRARARGRAAARAARRPAARASRTCRCRPCRGVAAGVIAKYHRGFRTPGPCQDVQLGALRTARTPPSGQLQLQARWLVPDAVFGPEWPVWVPGALLSSRSLRSSFLSRPSACENRS